MGMKCTKIGGSELANSRVTFAGAVTYLASGKEIKEQNLKPCENSMLSGQITSLFPLGFCGMITYSWWANRVVSEFVDPNFRAQK